MWILYVLLYLLGIFITVFITSYFDADFNDPMYVFMALFWPLTVAILIVFFIPVALGFVAYDAGQWYKHKKDTMSFIEYMKTESFFGR